jgi:dihydrolipoamide dehydrogenase
VTDYDLLVIGGGTGNNVAAAGADAGMETALVEPGPLGGTCLNRGCNPSKMLIQAASAANQVRDAERFFLDADLRDIDYAAIIDDMDETLSPLAEGMEASYREKSQLTLYDERAEFIDNETVDVGGEQLTATDIVVAAGSRPVVPPIDGLDSVDYMTSQDALYRRDQPESLVILGGGYIALELGYFFESLGTPVTIIEMEDTLLPREDPDVSQTITELAAERHDVHVGHRATAVEEDGDEVTVHAESAEGETVRVSADDVLVALGRRPNTDSVGLDATDVKTDEHGFIVTDDQLRSSVEGIWAQGDIADNGMFKHSGDYETSVMVDNVVHGKDRVADFSAMPHAIFTEPQIAGVGSTEAELTEAGIEYTVGRADLPSTPMGRAKKLDTGFVKVLASPDGDVLGCHMLGHEATTMIHEVVVAMRAGSGTVADITDTIHAHPTLNKVVEYAFNDAER